MEFQGVKFTNSQSLRLESQIKVISQLTIQKQSFTDCYNYNVGQVNQATSELSNCGKNDNNCKRTANGKWTYHANERDNCERQINDKNNEIAAANKNYNDILAGIQSEIKLSIQASQANSEAANQLAQNQININQNSIPVLEAKTKNESDLLKNQSDNNKKIIFFVVGGLVVSILGFFILKKLSV